MSFEALVASIVGDYAHTHDPAREAAWIAEAGGGRVGCVFCVRGDDDRTARLRILLVDPVARGGGLGARLVETCQDFARGAGYDRIVLWTNANLVAAVRIYERAGFALVDEHAHSSFGRDLIGQTWACELSGAGQPQPREPAVDPNP